MEKKHCFKLNIVKVLCIIVVAVLLAACGSETEDRASSDILSGVRLSSDDTSSGNITQEFETSGFHASHASGIEGASLDLADASDGYISASAESDSRLKLQVICGEQTYNYDLPSDGTEIICPLQCGDGTYSVRIMENVTGNSYSELYSEDVDVTLEDEFAPYTVPNVMVDYSEDSACVALADELASGADNDSEVVNAVCNYICENISYDFEEAEAVDDGYIPDLDAIIAKGSGICVDYASLAAAMLRSQGIPTKVVFGYVSPGNIYHAWNEVYVEETGWVSIAYDVDEEAWSTLDLTFSANGTNSNLISENNEYAAVLYY